MCEADDACPYGCDAKLKAWGEKAEADEEQCAKNDKVYLLVALLIRSAWVRRLTELSAPEAVIAVHLKQQQRFRKYATAWTEAEFQRHWPVFWVEFRRDDRRINIRSNWLDKLYCLYYTVTPDGAPN